MQQTKLVGLQLFLLLLFLFYPKCYDFSKPRLPHMQAASRQGEALEDAQIEHVLLNTPSVMKLARSVIDAKRQTSFATAMRKTATLSS